MKYVIIIAIVICAFILWNKEAVKKAIDSAATKAKDGVDKLNSVLSSEESKLVPVNLAGKVTTTAPTTTAPGSQITTPNTIPVTKAPQTIAPTVIKSPIVKTPITITSV